MKKAYEAPALKVHGSVEDLTQFTGGSNTEMVFGAPVIDGPGPVGNCSKAGGNFILGCADLGS